MFLRLPECRQSISWKYLGRQRCLRKLLEMNCQWLLEFSCLWIWGISCILLHQRYITTQLSKFISSQHYISYVFSLILQWKVKVFFFFSNSPTHIFLLIHPKCDSIFKRKIDSSFHFEWNKNNNYHSMNLCEISEKDFVHW